MIPAPDHSNWLTPLAVFAVAVALALYAIFKPPAPPNQGVPV